VGSFFSVHRLTVWFSIIALVVKLIISKSAEDLLAYDIAEPNVLSYICDFIILLMAFFAIKWMPKEFLFFYIAFIVLTITFSVSTYVNDGEVFSALKSLLRIFTPIFAFSHYAGYFKNRRNELMLVSKIILVTIICLTIIGFITLPPAQNRADGFDGGLWWPAYFTNIHTTTYVFSAIFFISFSLYKIDCSWVSKRNLILCFCVVFYCIGFGWGIRTSTISILLIVFCISYIKAKDHYSHVSPVLFVCCFSLIPVLYYLFFDFETLSSLSSGRVAMYVEKYYQLSGNSVSAWLIGNGVGSDLIETDVWSWGKKGAHSDFITMLVEGGLVYFTLFIAIHIKLFSILKCSQTRFLVISIAVTGVVSNGLFSRPLGLYVAVIALTIGYYDAYNRGKKVDK